MLIIKPDSYRDDKSKTGVESLEVLERQLYLSNRIYKTSHVITLTRGLLGIPN